MLRLDTTDGQSRLVGTVVNATPNPSHGAALYMPYGIVADSVEGLINAEILIMSQGNGAFPSSLLTYSLKTGQEVSVTPAGHQDMIRQPLGYFALP